MRIRSYSGQYFPAFGLNTERYFISLCIQSEYGKIRTRENCIFGHFSRSSCSSDCSEKFSLNVNKELIRLNINLLKDSEPFVELLFWATAFVSTFFLFVNSSYLLICSLFIATCTGVAVSDYILRHTLWSRPGLGLDQDHKKKHPAKRKSRPYSEFHCVGYKFICDKFRECWLQIWQ